MPYIDLSVRVDGDTYGPPSTNVKVGITPNFRGPGFWVASSLNMSIHTGSHIDVPSHVYQTGKTTDDLAVDTLFGQAVRIDLRHVGAEQGVTEADLERSGVAIQPGEIVLLNTGWSDRMWGHFPEYFTRSPYLTVEAARWLAVRHPRAVGFDFFEEYAARLPDFGSEDFVVHKELLGHGIFLMEQLTNLGSLPDRAEFFAAFYKVGGVEGAPARFFARVDAA